MNWLAKIFTWWNGATLGTMLWSWRKGEQVGTDAQGNTYFRSKNTRKNVATDGSYTGRERRWVMYAGSNDASQVPAEWHGWLHGAGDDVPEILPARRQDLGSGLYAQCHRHRASLSPRRRAGTRR